MSFDFNYKFWLSTKKDINQLLKKQNLLKQIEPIEDYKVTFRILSQIYILYAELIGKLAYIYGETLQVQKRDVIRKLVEPAIHQFLELKNKLKQLELNEYVYLDKYLIEQKLTPYDLLMWSSCFVYNRPMETKAAFLESQHFVRKTFEEVVHAIIKIQSHERARKARLLKCALEYKVLNLEKNIGRKVAYSFSNKNDRLVFIPIKRTIFGSNFMKSNIMCQKPLRSENLDDTQSNDDHDLIEQMKISALTIQRAWKNYKARKILKMKLNTKQTLYGMRKTKRTLMPDEYDRNKSEMHKKHLKQKQLEQDYVQLMKDERRRLLQEHKPQIMEDISDHIRAWFREFYEKTGDFHPYPDAIQSGTVLLLLDETMDTGQFQEYQQNQLLSKAQQKMLKDKLDIGNAREKEKKKKEELEEMRRQMKLRKSGTHDIGGDLKKNKNIRKYMEILNNRFMTCGNGSGK